MSLDQTKAEITFEDFVKVDLRAGTVLNIEPVPKSKKLLKLEVDFGPLGKRTILAGLAPILNVDAVGPGSRLAVGQQVVAVVNLAPKNMMGFTSHGMILAAADQYGTIHPVNLGLVDNGTSVG